MQSKKIFWGLFFILAAVYVVVSKLGMLPDIGAFKILLTVLMLCLMAEGIRRVNFYEILLPAALIVVFYDDMLGISKQLTPWTILVAALFASIGLSMLFHKKRKGSEGRGIAVEYTQQKGTAGAGGGQSDGERIRFENNFGSAIRYINSDNFREAHVENNFGTLSVYLDNAMVQGGEAYVDVENNFGETNLYIPKEWQVTNDLDHAFGAVNNKGKCVGSSTTVLYLRGSANFGVINIYYI